MTTPVSGNQLPQEMATKERVVRFIARTAVISLAALAVFAILAVSVPSAGAPAWLVGAALFFESLSAPSLLGFVISVKAVVYCLAGLAILLSANIGLITVTSKPKDSNEYGPDEYNPYSEYEEVSGTHYSEEDQIADEEEDDRVFEEHAEQQALKQEAQRRSRKGTSFPGGCVCLVRRLLDLDLNLSKQEIQQHRCLSKEMRFTEDVFTAAEHLRLNKSK